MIHVLKSFAAKAWAAVVLLLVLAGVLVGSTRLLLPLVSEYRNQLAADISAAIEAPVRIGDLSARLSGLSPELRLSGVEILDPKDGKVQLRFQELRLRLGLLESLRSGQPRIDLATLVGARLVLRRRADGGMTMIGLGSPDRPEAADGGQVTLAPFLGEGRLRLLDGEILWDNRGLGLPSLHIQVTEAELVNAGMRHQLDIQGHIAGSGAPLELHADLFGEPGTVADWRGEIHCRFDALELGPLLRPYLPADYPLEAQAELILWSRWRGGLPQTLEARFALEDARLGDTLLAEHLSAGLHWQRQGAGDWRLALSDLELWRDDRTHLNTELTLWSLQRGEGRQFQFGLREQRLEDLAALAVLLPLDPSLRDTLQRVQPRGLLRDLRALLQWSVGEAGPRWQAAGVLEGLALQPLNGAPGVQGLDLRFRMDPEHGVADLDADDLRLEFPGLFRWPFEVRRLAGELRWRQADDGLRIDSPVIRLDTPHIATESRVRVELPVAGPLFIDLQTDFRDADGTATSQYLPVGIMSDELVAWLDRAIVSGRVPSGGFLLRGPIDAFPFYQKDGVFEVLFGTENVILDYQEGWPRLEETLAEVHFHNEGLDIWAQEARLLSSRVRDTHAWLPDLDDARQLFIQGRVQGPFADTFRILRETPLAPHKARYVAGLAGRGRSEVRLDLAIPVDDGEDYRIDGKVLWRENADLLLKDLELTVEKLNGSLAFNDTGVFSDGIRGRLWDMPLQAVVRTDAGGDGEAGSTRVEVDLPLQPATLAKQYSHDWWLALQGTAPARLSLDIGHGAGSDALPVSYRMASDLRGIRVDLPIPLGKEAGLKRTLSIAGNMPIDNGDLIRLGYGDIQGSFRLLKDPETARLSLDAGVVHCDTDSSPQVKRSGFVLGGHLAELDAGAWADWLGEHAPASRRPTEERRNPSQRVDLAIDLLHLPKGRLNDVLLGMVRTPNAWEMNIRSRELEGTIRLPDGGRHKPVSAQLKTLRLEPEQWQVGEERAGPTRLPDPRQARGLYLSVQDLYLGGRPFGRLDIKASPVPQGLRLEQLSLNGPLLTLEGEGSWLDDAGGQASRLQLKGGSADLGRALRELNFTTALGRSPMEFQADLRWPAPLLEPDLGSVRGELAFHIGEGRILDVDPGVGRLFGLLNLGAVKRRLTLDFSDLFSEGYAFDSIDARFRIGDGNALAEQVDIVGPAADLSISGRTGLVARDYAQVVTVTPEISVTLPLAGALAGGPVVAAALLLAEQVMGEEVNKLIRYQYNVSGSWDEPKIERIETQDGWSLSNLLRPTGEQPKSPAQQAQEEQGLSLH